MKRLAFTTLVLLMWWGSAWAPPRTQQPRASVPRVVDDGPGGGVPPPPPPCVVPLTSKTLTNSPQPTLAMPLFGVPVSSGLPYNAPIVRIVPDSQTVFAANDTAGTQRSNARGVWGLDGRHHYAKDQPWNADMTLVMLQNKTTIDDSSGAPQNLPTRASGNTEVIVRATDFSITSYGQCPNLANQTVYIRERRWHPVFPDLQIVLSTKSTTHDGDASRDSLYLLNVKTCERLAGARIPIHATGFNNQEGNVTVDGSVVMLYTEHYNPTNGATPDTMVIANIDPSGVQFGTPYPIPPCSLSTGADYPCDIDNGSVSPLGNYVILQYHGGGGAAGEGGSPDTIRHFRVFEINGLDIVGPRSYARDSLNRMCGCSMLGGGMKHKTSTGWISNLDHVDYAVLNGNEYAVGGRQCGGSKGRVERVSLNDGSNISLSSPVGESAQQHTSARNTQWPGWVFISYQRNATRLNDEFVAYKMDGSGEMIRFGQSHSEQAYYRGEAHLVPSPDGKQLMFSSDFMVNSGGTGRHLYVRSYILDLRNQCSIGPNAAQAYTNATADNPEGDPGGDP